MIHRAARAAEKMLRGESRIGFVESSFLIALQLLRDKTQSHVAQAFADTFRVLSEPRLGALSKSSVLHR